MNITDEQMQMLEKQAVDMVKRSIKGAFESPDLVRLGEDETGNKTSRDMGESVVASVAGGVASGVASAVVASMIPGPVVPG